MTQELQFLVVEFCGDRRPHVPFHVFSFYIITSVISKSMSIQLSAKIVRVPTLKSEIATFSSSRYYFIDNNNGELGE